MGNTMKKKTKSKEIKCTESYVVEEVCESFSGNEERSCSCDKATNTFIPITQLTLEKLPDKLQDSSLLDFLTAVEKLVVHLYIKVPGEGKGHTGTGFAWIGKDEVDEYDKCPVSNCPVLTPHKSYGGVIVYTNHHVVANDKEAAACQVRFFFNEGKFTPMFFDKINAGVYHCGVQGNGETTVLAFGQALREHRVAKDLVGLQIIFHEKDLFEMVQDFTKKRVAAWSKIRPEKKDLFKQHAVVISHPHGEAKVISFGKLLSLEEDKEKEKVTRYTASTCTGSSGAPVLTGHYATRPFTHRGKEYSETSVVNISNSF
ncbi:uncharacterized protein LOC106066232 isoform X2 [Biomphalaria glabrata]|uniref:Uncharacterized protein LOC106066232 isoform X2 n=1 Tax=Biomphalaria glabrata TaxID=6526 RepID=A0A9W2YBT8_BIOGL|nr:uncharacterized protein LOC106066232 isoform X2 [Biomphalaria glabrata]